MNISASVSTINNSSEQQSVTGTDAADQGEEDSDEGDDDGEGEVIPLASVPLTAAEAESIERRLSNGYSIPAFCDMKPLPPLTFIDRINYGGLSPWTQNQ